MKNLIEKLEKKFDEYHNEQLRIDNKQDPDYYLFMGKASAIGDLLTELENEQKEKLHIGFQEWAECFFTIPSKHLDNYFSKEMAFEDFKKTTKLGQWSANKFKKQLKAYCELNGYILNPEWLRNLSQRIVRKMEGKTQEVLYIHTKK